MHAVLPAYREILHAHLFAGLGGGARGFNRASARVGNLTASFRCLGGIDVDAAALSDFERLAGVRGTRLDLFDREQYRAFHDAEPAPDWREATAADVHAAFGHERPHILFLSPPCKGFSGLLSESKSKLAKYQALNRLTLRGLWLALEAYADDPVELILLENVPRIASRGRALLDRMTALLRAYGYAVAETTHDCGELGALAQSRRRFLLVSRHQGKVPPFLYEPPKRSLRGVGDVLGRMPLPGDGRGGPMHRVPNLSRKTWVRLAFVEAGSDWRSLSKLRVQDGMLADYRLVPEVEWRRGTFGVCGWQQPSGTVAGESLPSNGRFSVADPRLHPSAAWNDGQQLGVKNWDQPGATVTAQAAVGGGAYAVADLRHAGPAKYSNVYRIVPWSGTCPAVTSSKDMAVADPRPNLDRRKGDDWIGAGHYGVVPWDASTGAISAAAGYDNGSWSVADPRSLPGTDERLVAVIRAWDNTWHRPFTTLELAALQSLVDPEEQLELQGLSDQAWRERIGNAVPPDAAQAIAETMGRTLLLAWIGEGFMLSSVPIWVRPVAAALSLRTPEDARP